MYYGSIYNSPVGQVLILINEEKELIAISYVGKDVPSYSLGLDKDFEAIKSWLDDYFFAKARSANDLKINLRGTDFQLLVWQELLKLSFAELITYKELAARVALKMNVETMSAQAIGGAVGANPLAIVIPCHRVVGTNHKLLGYSGGIDKKIKLLELEGIDLSKYLI